MKILTMDAITVGLRVVFVDSSLNRNGSYVDAPSEDLPLAGRSGIVVGFGSSPGRQIAVCLKEPLDKAHTCDGFTPDKHGAWARAENLYTEESYAAHKAAFAEANKANAELDAAKAKALDVARGYLGDGVTETMTITAADVATVDSVIAPKKKR